MMANGGTPTFWWALITLGATCLLFGPLTGVWLNLPVGTVLIALGGANLYRQRSQEASADAEDVAGDEVEVHDADEGRTRP